MIYKGRIVDRDTSHEPMGNASLSGSGRGVTSDDDSDSAFASPHETEAQYYEAHSESGDAGDPDATSDMASGEGTEYTAYANVSGCGGEYAGCPHSSSGSE